jgi:enolase
MPQIELIDAVQAREVLDSRGNPTVEVEVRCAGGAWGRAIVPSGASTGRHEAIELRDSDPARFSGKGVLRAVDSVRREMAPRILGLPVVEQSRIDRLLCELDGSPNKSRLGANALLGVSLACAHAAAAVRQLPLWRHLDADGKASLPMPMINMISGGLHAGGHLDFQDFLLIPVGAGSYSEALSMAVKVYRALAAILQQEGFESVLVGDEGGFGPRLRSTRQAAELVVRAIEGAGLTPGKDAGMAIDVAASHFYKGGRYALKEGTVTTRGMVDFLSGLVDQFPVVSIEDGVAEDDWDGWKKLTEALGRRVQLIGDDLFVTNPQRLKQGIDARIANSILIKVNQIGTLTETLEVMELARSAGYRTIVSARSGETEDATIADLAVGTGAGQIKIGSVARSERLAKYNQLLRIEEAMQPNARFAGWQPI